MILLCIIPVTATIQSLGEYIPNSCVILKQTCGNCTYSYISTVMAKSSNGSSIQVLGLASMTKVGYEYYYTFCNTSYIGEYIVNGYSDVDGYVTVWAYNFYITNSGIRLSTGEAILYVVGFMFLLGFFLSCLYLSFVIPFRNAKEQNPLMPIKLYRIYKIGAIMMLYLSMMFLVSYSMQLALNITNQGLFNLLNYLYKILVQFAYIFFILFAVLGLIFFIYDYIYMKKMKKVFSGGNPFGDI